MMPCVAVVLFDHGRMRLADDVTFRRQDVGESFPIVGVKDAIRQVFYFVVKPLEGCSITTADNPGNSSP